MTLLTCHYIICLAVHELYKDSCDHSLVQLSRQSPMRCLYCAWCFLSPWYGCVSTLMEDPTGTVPQRPHPHILMRLALGAALSLYAQSQLVVRRQTVSSVCSLYIFLPLHSLKPHTHTHHPTYLVIYHHHAHIHVLCRLPTGLVIAARLFCIHMRESQLSLFPFLFLSYEYKIIKAESKRTWEIFSIPIFPISCTCGDSSDTWLSCFIWLRMGQV